MLDFTYWAPTQIVFGRKAETQAGALVRRHGGSRVLLHFGGGSAQRSGLLDRVRLALRGAGLPFVELGGVAPNPRLSLARQGIALARRERCDFILAVGGGSVIDSAKCVAYGAANEGDVWDFYMGLRRPAACLPVGCVLTIAAAGSEMSPSSVVTEDAAGLKRSCRSDMSRPAFAVMNPELTMTLPPFQTACGCVDICVHTMERYFCGPGGTLELTDSLAAGLLRTVMRHAAILMEDPANYAARAEILWAGSLSHNGLTGCGSDGGDWATHMIEHEVSGMFDVAHGAGLAAIWGSWARHVLADAPERFAAFALDVMGVPPLESPAATAGAGIEAVERFFRSLGMPLSLKELGVSPTDAQIADMARKALLGRPHIGALRRLHEPDVEAILRAAR